MNTGELIRFYRRKNKLTQSELAEKCGTSSAMIRQYELGKRNPKIETLDKLAFALNVHIRDLSTFSIEEWKKTDEFKRGEDEANCYYVIIKMLELMYKRAEIVSVEANTSNGPGYSSNYISIGLDEQKRAIPNETFDNIVKIVRNNLHDIIELISEDEKNFLSAWQAEEPDTNFTFSELEHVKVIIENEKGISYLPPF